MPASMQAQQTDVLIGGGGFAGLALAIALRQGLGETFSVTLADPALARAPNDARASAIVAAARRLFETIGVWDKVAGDAQPILDMAVTDSRLHDAVRPVFLTFEGDLEQPSQGHAGFVDQPAREPFAHMIENGPLLAALVARAKDVGVALRAAAIAGFSTASPLPSLLRGSVGEEGGANGYNSSARTTPTPDPSPQGGGEDARRGSAQRVAVKLSDGSTIAARLLVAADGARSRIRERAGIATHGWGYGQSAIVATVAHERHHHGRAEEHFLPAGPFAILPLTGKRSSIVWTEDSREAARIVALPDADFHAELEKRFGLRLGEISVAGPRRSYPVEFSVARSFATDRVALVGDAAHVIHPIAGQGLNMGLKDIAALAEVIADAARLGLDPGAASVLERYQRWRRFDTMAMGMATDGLNRLFSNSSDVLRVARDIGLGLVDRLPALKQVFIREAAGLVGEVPRLLKGEAL